MAQGLNSWPSRPIALVTASSLWIATVGNVPLWRELDALGLLRQRGGWLLAGALALVIAAALVALLSLLAWRFTLKPAILLLLAATTLGAHFMLQYRIVIDGSMLTNVLQTDRREAADLLDPGLLLSALWGCALPGWIVWRSRPELHQGSTRLWRNAAAAIAALLVAVAVVLASFQPLASAMRNHKQLRYLMNPLNSLYAAAQVVAQPLRRGPGRVVAVGQDARLVERAGRPPLLVLVLGETARAGNFSVNGYRRPTTPSLERENVASFRNVESCGTSTAASVPCMFSPLGREGFEARASDHENLLDVLQRAGLAVLWIDNQAGCKGVCARIPSTDTARDDKLLCRDGECLDGVLLEGIDERIAALPSERRERGVVLVLHQMGSHGPAYSRRSPPALKRFLPECTSTALAECSTESLVNAYDNSIAYTDHVLGATVAWLRGRAGDYDTALLYLSDHGESLGEHNLYLHGLPRAIAPAVQTHVPWITWLSPAFEQRSGVALDCLRAHADVPLSHDHLFHSVLGLMRVRTGAYRQALDAYDGCRSAG
jgi:lipid A ethanolaminephosphotransferase